MPTRRCSRSSCSTSFPDAEVRGFVQRALGRTLTADVGDQRLYIPHGTGANGKSTLLGLVRRLLEGYGVHLHPDVLLVTKHAQHPTALTDLLGARFAVTVEVEQGRRLAESLVQDADRRREHSGPANAP